MQPTPCSSIVPQRVSALEATSLTIPVQRQVSLSQKELTRLRWEGSYWKAQHQRACERELRLKQELAQKEAQIRDLQQRLFGKKSETTVTSQQVKLASGRPRGHQPGQRGHGRIQRPNLRVITEKLELSGVGYRAKKVDKGISMTLGFSHPVEFEVPAGITVDVEDNTKVTVSGIDKQLVGLVCAKIRKLRKPEPYKGKGIKFTGEVLRKKAGKSAGK